MSNQTTSNRPYLVPSLLFATIAGFYTIAACYFPIVFIWATYEDLFGEWVQFWSIMIAMAVSVRLVMMKSPFRWFFALLAISCLYVGMEEISWGQRVFGFSSPTYFQANNLQGETNFHNFLTGPYGTTLKMMISYALALALACYGLAYPIALRLKFRLAAHLNRLGVACPPLYLWPYFVAAAVLELSFFRFNEAEVAEILVGLGLSMTAVHYLCMIRGSKNDNTTSGKIPAITANHMRGLLKLQCAVVAFTLFLSAGTTLLLYNSSRGTAIDIRIENGVKKFAGRYARYKAWETAITLYEMVLESNPQSASVLRQLAECYQGLGDNENFMKYVQQAIDHDMAKYNKNRGSASVNRSLTRTHRLLGDEESAQKHLRIALRIGLKRVKKTPASAPAAYSLGKTYSLAERHGEALKQLSRAYKLNPTSKKYRKAYYSAKNKVS